MEYFAKVANNDWQDQVKVLSHHSKYHVEFLEIISKFKPLWDGNLECIKAVHHWIELNQTDSWILQSMPHRTGPKARKLEHCRHGSCGTGEKQVGVAHSICNQAGWEDTIPC